MIRKQAVSKLPPEVLKKMLGMALVGAPVGALFGKYVTPKIFGYQGDPAATNMSMLLDAAMFGGLAAMSKNPGQYSRILSSTMGVPTLAGTIATSELIPVGLGTLRQTAAGLSKPTASENVGSMLKSPTAKGMGVGAAGAGLAGLTSGLLRAPNTAEQAGGDSRTQMAVKDILKFLIPAMLAGGVGGQLIGQRRPSGRTSQVAKLEGASQPVAPKVRG